MTDKAMAKLVRIWVGTANLQDNPGTELSASELFHHPERIKLEAEHRKQASSGAYEPFAGPYDITVVKVNEPMRFNDKRVMPICLFGGDFQEFKYGYIAGFGSMSFSTKCWTARDGPHPFEECKETQCITAKAPQLPKACEKVDMKKAGDNVQRVYVQGEGDKLVMCPKKGSYEKYGWCHVKELPAKSKAMDVQSGVDWGLCSRHCSEDVAKNSAKILEARLDLLKGDQCATLGKSSGVDVSIELCAAAKNVDKIPYAVFDGNGKQVKKDVEKAEYFGGTDACQGDSGGPLWVWTYKQGSAKVVQGYQVAIVSRGEGCAYRNKPGIFTMLAKHKEFIRNIMEKHGGCLKYKTP